MARKTDFGGVCSHADLHLIQQAVDVQPAKPKLNLVKIPGANGSKDLSEAPSGRIVYEDRTITWTFALYPGDKWEDKHSQVSGALNGKRCRITLDRDPGYYYLGRVSVDKHKKDGLLGQITVKATCHPFKFKQAETQFHTALDKAQAVELTLANDRMPTVPTITTTAGNTIISWGSTGKFVAAGTHKILDLELQEGDNVVRFVIPNEAGEVTITYQEGAL